MTDINAARAAAVAVAAMTRSTLTLADREVLHLEDALRRAQEIAAEAKRANDEARALLSALGLTAK